MTSPDRNTETPEHDGHYIRRLRSYITGVRSGLSQPEEASQQLGSSARESASALEPTQQTPRRNPSRQNSSSLPYATNLVDSEQEEEAHAAEHTVSSAASAPPRRDSRRTYTQAALGRRGRSHSHSGASGSNASQLQARPNRERGSAASSFHIRTRAQLRETESDDVSGDDDIGLFSDTAVASYPPHITNMINARDTIASLDPRHLVDDEVLEQIMWEEEDWANATNANPGWDGPTMGSNPGWDGPTMGSNPDWNVPTMGSRSGRMKRTRDNFENAEGSDPLTTITSKREAISTFLYHTEGPSPEANDVWPNLRDANKLPAQYYILEDYASVDAGTKQKNLQSLRELTRPAKLLKTTNDTMNPAGDDVDMPSTPGWPPGQLPTELYEEITEYLNRDDIQSMRLVCREFNTHVSQVLFKSAVVPFNTEIYGMLGHEKQDLKGKKKARVENKALLWKNASGDDVYNGHGLDVFRGFGQHILKFGMSFEVNEDSLSKPPSKTMTERHTSFWGSYEWPFEEYCRFDDVAGLESTADETPRMTVAFSELTKVRELGLSVDSGLGWLNGPDRSIRARILQRPPTVFGTQKQIPDRRAEAQNELWHHIESCHRLKGKDVKLATLCKLETNATLAELRGAPPLAAEQPKVPFLDPQLIHQAVPHDTEISVQPTYDDADVLHRLVHTPTATGTGILYTSEASQTDSARIMNPIIPANLTTAQKEWLLETEWAQRAFLSSYMLSIIDNPTTFAQVHTLNISRLSDRYIPLLNRKDFWDAMRNLENVTLLVIPGWRTVHKDEAGFVETPKVSPSSGIDPFHYLLKNMISHRPNIKRVTFGWATGGEHAEGIHARNRLLLPSPLMPADSATEQGPAALHDRLLRFPHVEELTLKNCWLTPCALEHFVKYHDKLSLKRLNLDSVSLTAVLRAIANGGAGFNHAQMVGANFPNLAAMNQQQFWNQIQTMQMQIAQVQAQGMGGQQLQNQMQQFQNQMQTQLQQQQQQQPQLQLQPQHNQLQQQLQILNQQLQIVIANQQPAVAQPQQMAAGQVVPPAQPQQLANVANPLLVIPPLQHGLHVQPQPIMPFNLPPPPQLGQPPFPNPQTVSPQVTLKEEPRDGSWLRILDIISPGINLSDFGSKFSEADPERTTSLESIQLISCGYAKLLNAHFEQAGIEAETAIGRGHNAVVRKFAGTMCAMLSTKWALLGEIVQDVNADELAALMAGFDLVTGWEDEDARVGPEFDGCLPGGTGRLTGVIGRRVGGMEMGEDTGFLFGGMEMGEDTGWLFHGY